jgi:hypothetical protein
MIIFLSFLFLSLMMILGLGVLSREDERLETESPGDGEAGVGAGFLTTTGAAPHGPDRSSRVEDLVAQLEQFVRREAAAVAAFVATPSIEGLLGDADRGPGEGDGSTDNARSTS